MLEEVPITTYAFDNAWQQARQRLAALETWMDPGTVRHLTERGVGPGWRCLEVGAGGGSVAAWLCVRVGQDGSVLATDINTRFIDVLDHPNLESLCHDVARDPLPAASFDLAHCRLVLAHLPERDVALDRMIAALKPGGWLVVEELDFGSVALDPSRGAETVALFDRAIAAHHRALQARGMDPLYGRRLLGDLRARGLAEIGTGGRVFSWNGGSPGATAWRLTFVQLGEEMIATGEITADDLATAIQLLDDPNVALLSQATVAAWGRCSVA